jgi:DNA polymerase III gamma/tau subunit
VNIRQHDRSTFLVESRSNPESGDHIVDIEERTCSCEGFQFHKTCDHLKTLMPNETETQELALVPEADHAQIETLKRVDDPWEEFKAKIPTLESSATALVVTKENYLVLSDAARAIRLKVRGTRIEIEHKREELVEDLNKRTKAINTAARSMREKLEGMEEKLLEQEKFAERETARLLAEKREARIAEITPFLSAPPLVDLGLVKDDAYAGMLGDAKGAHAARLAREQREREEAEAKAKTEAEERERIRLENERLKKEAAEREAAAKAEREAAEKARIEAEEAARRERETAEAVLKAEREKAERERKEAAEKARKEREAIEAKARAEKEAAEAMARKERAELEAKAKKEREEREAKEKAERIAANKLKAQAEAEHAAVVAEANRKAAEARKEAEALRAAQESERKRIADDAAALAKAPDKTKLAAVAESVWSIKLPEMATEEGKLVLEKLSENIKKLATWIETKANEL